MDYAAQGRGWQGHISFKKVSLAKDTTLMGILWPWDSLITQVNSLDRDKGLSAVRCLYWISSKGSGYPAYTFATSLHRYIATSLHRSLKTRKALSRSVHVVRPFATNQPVF